MDEEPTDARELFNALVDHEGPDVFGRVVVPWLAKAGRSYRDALAHASTDGVWRTGEGVPERQDLYLPHELYALSRVSDALLHHFQPAPDPDGTRQWSGALSTYDGWPVVSRAEYLELFTTLGMSPFDGTDFDPFRHEITEVEQSDDPDEPIRITEVVWPGLMLGQLLFGRAGVRVRAGARRARRGVADCSPLYWTYLRRYRPTRDLSDGWGSNSQWRTDLRLDYRTPAATRLNVAESTDIDDPAHLGDEGQLLTPAERRDLLRHRCLLRAPDAAPRLGAPSRWGGDLFPYAWRLPGPEEGTGRAG
ncbi:hypothetical protein PUR34_40130 [Streptomyces sp. JV185]|uniref:hypothetical protein n=1 Tax=Streptomyces sp. JV185 TaxID=858638 RepID=UPI002E788A69|nr:hypothetical protein [Streptomyces sp. JV185]MEE1774219.1 hypothetical protein [Streptomyces sp. JV185]